MPNEETVLARRYRLVEELGRGGMGVVWRARDELIDRDVAVKQVHAPFNLNDRERDVYRERAMSEARNAGRISHAGVVSVHDIVPARSDGDAVFLVMELISAPTLEQVILRDGPLSAERVGRIAVRLCEALEAAHLMGVVHRDVKPANIHLLPRDEIKLVDFGIAHAAGDSRFTRTGATMGTGPYMAPELFDGEEPSPGSDWWSLGVTLYQAVTGVSVFQKPSTAAILRAILFDPIPEPACHAPLSTVITGLLDRNPGTRLSGTDARDLLAPPETDPEPQPSRQTTQWPSGVTFQMSMPSHGRVRPRTDPEIPALERQRDRQRRELGPEHSDTLRTSHDLAVCQGETGDYRAAVSALTQVRDVRARVLGADHPDTLSCGSALADWRGRAGQVVAAIDELERVLAAQTRVRGPDHPDTLSTRGKLAGWRGFYGDDAGRRSELMEVWRRRNRALGPDHPDTLLTRHDLATSLNESDDPAATGMLEELLADQERVLGADHSDTLATRQTLADARGRAGDVATAVSDLERIRRDLERVMGADHPRVFGARGLLAQWRGKAADPAAELTMREDLLADETRVLGADHPQTLGTRHMVAVSRGESGDPSRAITDLERLRTDVERVLGTQHPDAFDTHFSLASLRYTVADFGTAEKEFHRYIQDCDRTLGADDPLSLTVRCCLPALRTMQGDAAAFRAEVEPLLPGLIRVLGPENSLVMNARYVAAFSRFIAGDPAAAVAELEQLLATQEESFGTTHPDTRQTSETLESFHGFLGFVEEARRHPQLLEQLGSDVPFLIELMLARALGAATDPASTTDLLTQAFARQTKALGPEHEVTIGTGRAVAYWRWRRDR